MAADPNPNPSSSDQPAQKPLLPKDPKKKKDEKKEEDLSDEDLALKQQLELYVERAQDPDPGVQKLALESMRHEIRTSTSWMTSVPKPLKFLRPHYGALKAYFETMAESDLKKYLADILSVLALTMSTEGERESLKYRLFGSEGDIGSWGHEYVRDLLKNLKRHKDEDAIKGQAVKNQKELWDKTLEFRFLLQKPFSSSNKLPQEPVKSSFCSSDRVVVQAYADLVSSCKQTLDCMLELQGALLEQNHSIVESTAGNTKQSTKDGLLPNDLKGEADEDWLQIHEMYSRIAPFRNNSVDKWHRKTQVATGAAAFKGKLYAFNQNISDQVAGYMRDPSRMIKRMQLGSFSVGTFGKVPENSESIKEEDVNVEGDPELLDDSEFYQQLLKEFFESCDLTSSDMAFHALKKLQPKKRKIVDRRASKSRKIRYSVHEKIVNFMAPVPMNLPQMAPKLFENLFGMGNQKSSSALQSAAVGMS